MKHRKRAIRITLAVIVLAGATAVLYAWLQAGPRPETPEWWFRQAVEHARAVADRSDREMVLERIAKTQASAGYIREVKATLSELEPSSYTFTARVRRTVNNLLVRTGLKSGPVRMPHADYMTSAWAGRASSLARAGNTRAALRIAERAGLPSHSSVFLDIATAQIEAGDIDAAEATANAMSYRATGYFGGSDRESALRHVALARATAGDVARALKLADDHGLSWFPEYDIASAAAKGGHLDDAKAAAREIPNPLWRAMAYQELVRIQAESGDIEGAKATARDIEVFWPPKEGKDSADVKIMAQMSGDGAAENFFSISTAMAYREIVIVQAESGDMEGARATVQEMDALDEKRTWAETARADLAYVQAKSGDIAGALSAIKTLRITQDYAYGRVCEGQAEYGDISGAKATLQRMGGSRHEQRARRAVAIAQARASDLDGAKATAAELKPEEAVWRDLAEICASAGDMDAYAEHMELARKAADLLSYFPRRQELLDIMKAHARMHDLEVVIATAELLHRDHRPRYRTYNTMKKLLLIARTYVAKSGIRPELSRWIETLEEPLGRACACLGAAEGLIEKQAASSSQE